MQQAVAIEQLGKGLEKYKHDTELQFKYYREVLGAEVAEATIVGKATADLVGQTKFNGSGNHETGETEPTSETISEE